MKSGWLTWGVDGYGVRHYLCALCGERFGDDTDGPKFENDIAHVCEEIKKKQILTVCCVCHRVRVGDRWLDGELAERATVGRLLSHGYCPRCFAKANAELDALENEGCR